MQLNLQNTKSYEQNTHNPSFQRLVRIDKKQIIYNLRVNKATAVAKANMIAEAKAGLEEMAKKCNVKIRVTAAFQQPFISVKRKGLKSIIDSAKGIFAGNFANSFEKDSIIQKAQNVIDNLTEQVAGYSKTNLR